MNLRADPSMFDLEIAAVQASDLMSALRAWRDIRRLLAAGNQRHPRPGLLVMLQFAEQKLMRYAEQLA